MKPCIDLNPDGIKRLRQIGERLVSYNIEMTEVTGGTFWKAYTPGQIAGTEAFPPLSFGDRKDFTAMSELMEDYPPIDLYNEKLRALASALGPAWIRVSGSWATKTYYDFAGETGGKAPAGYQSVLTKEQWIGVLDFVQAVGGKLLVSVSNCGGDHPGGGLLDLSQTRKLFAFSHSYGVDIAAAEFMNEPNLLALSGAPAGYTAKDYARDQDRFFQWVRQHEPDCLLVGPCATSDPSLPSAREKGLAAGMGSVLPVCTTQDLMEGTTIRPDVFSYHYYNGISERGASFAPNSCWSGDAALSEVYLSVAPHCARDHAALRDRYVPGGPVWVTESGDAGAGGSTWASTYLDVPRTLNELGSFATITDGVIFHNTLASSDYGFLNHGTFAPRPNYFAVWLWNQLMGPTVYDCGNPNVEGAHLYCHSRRDGKAGVVYLLINNSPTETTTVHLPKQAEQYTLSAETLRATTMMVNGMPLTEPVSLSDLPKLVCEEGLVEVQPRTCTFLRL